MAEEYGRHDTIWHHPDATKISDKLVDSNYEYVRKLREKGHR